jgi:hypothetical protein
VNSGECRHEPKCLKELKVELDVYGRVVGKEADEWDVGFSRREEVVDFVEDADDSTWGGWGGIDWEDSNEGVGFGESDAGKKSDTAMGDEIHDMAVDDVTERGMG